MRLRKLHIIFILCLVTFQCRTQPDRFSIEIKHFSGAVGLTLYYSLNDKLVKVDMDCDFENCKKKTVYKRAISKLESDSVLRLLQSLRLDTLKKEYHPEGMVLDGLAS